jgi:transposase
MPRWIQALACDLTRRAVCAAQIACDRSCGSATTCWRRLDEWTQGGVFDQLQLVLLDELGDAGRIDLDRVSVDSFSLRAVNGGI